MSAAFAVTLFVALCAALLAGFPVAFTLGGVALLFAALGWLAGAFDPVFLEALPNRIFGALGNETLLAVPLFVFMGLMLERSGVAEDLLETMARLFGRVRGGHFQNRNNRRFRAYLIAYRLSAYQRQHHAFRGNTVGNLPLETEVL